MKSNSCATSRDDTDCEPAFMALSPGPNKPVDTSPIPQMAKPPARNTKKTFINGDFEPVLNDCNIEFDNPFIYWLNNSLSSFLTGL